MKTAKNRILKAAAFGAALVLGAPPLGAAESSDRRCGAAPRAASPSGSDIILENPPLSDLASAYEGARNWLESDVEIYASEMGADILAERIEGFLRELRPEDWKIVSSRGFEAGKRGAAPRREALSGSDIILENPPLSDLASAYEGARNWLESDVEIRASEMGADILAERIEDFLRELRPEDWKIVVSGEAAPQGPLPAEIQGGCDG